MILLLIPDIIEEFESVIFSNSAVSLVKYFVNSSKGSSVPIIFRPTSNSQTDIILYLTSPPEINDGHKYEFHEAKAVKITTVKIVGTTIGIAILNKYLQPTAPSTIATSLILPGIASNAFLNINALKIEATNGIATKNTIPKKLSLMPGIHSLNLTTK